jgi:D-psicose/D-tagatose/L-ribulose 3-epimerase
MKIAFSNIAWQPHDDLSVLALLKDKGIAGIEIAPTRVWPKWNGATAKAAERYGKWLKTLGFEVPALQAVLFGRPDAQLFDAEGASAFVSHLAYIAELAQALCAQVVVLGAPRQRNRGALGEDDAYERAAEILYHLAVIFAARGACLCIEPNPRQYACNFVTNVEEALELIRRVNHPGFALHLDAAGMFLEADRLKAVWPRAGHLVRHYHISEPDLGDFRAPQIHHRANLAFLASTTYSGWCSVEMREPSLPLSVSGPWHVLPESE